MDSNQTIQMSAILCLALIGQFCMHVDHMQVSEGERGRACNYVHAYSQAVFLCLARAWPAHCDPHSVDGKRSHCAMLSHHACSLAPIAVRCLPASSFTAIHTQCALSILQRACRPHSGGESLRSRSAMHNTKGTAAAARDRQQATASAEEVQASVCPKRWQVTSPELHANTCAHTNALMHSSASAGVGASASACACASVCACHNMSFLVVAGG